jgi:chemotaxis methyl-accepting protein methylase
MPKGWRKLAFQERNGSYCLRVPFRAGVEFVHQDIREVAPEQRFDLILGRNVVLTYFAPDLRYSVLHGLARPVQPDGALIIGIHESPPDRIDNLVSWPGARSILQRVEPGKP